MAVGRFFKGTPQEYTNLNPYVELPFKEMLALAEMGNAKIDNASKNLELYYSDMLKKAAIPNSQDEAYLKAAQQKIYDIQKSVEPDKLLDPAYLQSIKSDILSTTKDPYLDDITKSAAGWQEYIQAATKDPGRKDKLVFDPKDYNTKTNGTFNRVYENVQDPTDEANKIASRFGEESWFDKNGTPMKGVSYDKINTAVNKMTNDVDFLNSSTVTRQGYDEKYGLGSYEALPFKEKQEFAKEFWKEQLYPHASPQIDWQGVNALTPSSSSSNKEEAFIPDLAFEYLNTKNASLTQDIINEVLNSKTQSLETAEGDQILYSTYVPEQGDQIIMELAHSTYPESVDLPLVEQKAADLSDKMSTWLTKSNNKSAFDLLKQAANYLDHVNYEYKQVYDKYIGNNKSNSQIHKDEFDAVSRKLNAANAKVNNILKASPELAAFNKQANELGYDIRKAEFENNVLNFKERQKSEVDKAVEAFGQKFQNSNKPIKFIPNSGNNKINVYNKQTGETDVLLKGAALMTTQDIWAAIPDSEGLLAFNWSDLGEKLIQEGKIIPYTKSGDYESGAHLAGNTGDTGQLWLVPVNINSKGFKDQTKLDAINRATLTPEIATKNAANFKTSRRFQTISLNEMNSQKNKFYNSKEDEAIFNSWQDNWNNIKAANASGELLAKGSMAEFSPESVAAVDNAFKSYKDGTISKRQFMETWSNLLDMQYNAFNPTYTGIVDGKK